MVRNNKTNHDKIDVSIIILNLDNFDLILDCLESYKRFKPKIRTEIIIVDNNSKDKRYRQLQKRTGLKIKLVENKENLGFGKGNNSGIPVSTGKYILLLNSDTLFIEDCITPIFNYMENNQNVGVSGCKLLNPDKTHQPSIHGYAGNIHLFLESSGLDDNINKITDNVIIKPMMRGMSRLLPNLLASHKEPEIITETESIMGAFYMIRKQVLDKVGIFDESFFLYHEEMELSYRIRKAGYKIMYNPNASIIHIGAKTTSRFGFGLRYFKAQSLMHHFSKHKPSLKPIHKASLLMGIFTSGAIGLIKGKKEFNKRKNTLKKMFGLLR